MIAQSALQVVGKLTRARSGTSGNSSDVGSYAPGVFTRKQIREQVLVYVCSEK